MKKVRGLFVLAGIAILGTLVAAPAAIAGVDDYPAPWRAPTAVGSTTDTWGYANRNCTSFVAWRLHSRNGFEMPRAIGDAGAWATWAKNHGYAVNTTPAVGSVAYLAGVPGHVAWVEAVGSGTVTIEEYNYQWPPGNIGNYHEGVNLPVSHYSGYIHFKDMSAAGSKLQPITGDWNGDRKTDIGLRRTSTGMFYFRTGPSWGQSTVTWSAGLGTDVQPITGDWNGDGKTDIGLRRISTGMFYFRTGPSWKQTSLSWSAGRGTDLQPITGDWNGDGKTDIGLRRISTGMFYFRTAPGWGQSTVAWSAGRGTDVQPITGDWNGDRKTDIGLRRISTGMFYFRTGPRWGQTSLTWSQGPGAGLQPITGDWNGDRKTDIGLRRISTGMFYFRTGPTWNQTTVTWSAGAG